MRSTIWPWLAAALLFQGVRTTACPLCLGWGQPTIAQRLVTAPQVVLAIPTAQAGRFRVIQVIKGELPTGVTLEGDYPRSGPSPGAEQPTSARPLLLVRDDPLPTWVILGAIDAARARWLRALAGGKGDADRSPAEWRARVALAVPHLADPEPLAAELAHAEVKAAPYAALRAAKMQLDTAALRRWLADPELAARHPLCLLLLGISGNEQDAAALEKRLETAWQSGDAANLSPMLAADLELRGASRMPWAESRYLTDRKRSTPEIQAALLALSVQGNANGVIPRERVTQSYRAFIKAHPEIAGDVASDLAAWQCWDAVPDYLALMKSGIRQQYPSHLAMLAYLRQSPNVNVFGVAPEIASTNRLGEDRGKNIETRK